jgi:hypothetical protein
LTSLASVNTSRVGSTDAADVDRPLMTSRCRIDHTTLFTPYHATHESDTIDGIGRGDPEDLKKFGEQFWKDGTGMMAHK